MLSTLDGPAYLSRVSVHKPAQIRKAARSIQKAFRYQIENKGFSLVEILATCPTNWKLTPREAVKWLENNMIPHYPLGEFKDVEGCE